MIKIDEEDPVGELEPSFPFRDVKIQRGVDVKELYELQSEIGRGKFGTVYRCREKSTGLELAAKFLSTARKEDRRNVEREIDIMRVLQHPRLIQLYDALEKDKQMAVILELIVGGELFERVIDDDFVLTEKSCTVFMRQICEGMEFIHKQEILHLDMKPENILCVTRTGNRIKIIDLGLARRFDPDKKLQVLFGTPEFVAPEVVNFDRIGFETDMWSIGVICYVLLSGLSPFMGETDIETMANVTIAKWDFDHEAFFEISDDAKDFISKLLVKDKENRMTAAQCLGHPWMRRRPPKKLPPQPVTPCLEVAKDNLKGFVDRWSEHPNSPYLFDTSFHTISPCVSLSHVPAPTPPPSMCPDSPSPCGSLTSLASPPATPQSSPRPPLKNPHLDRLSVFDRRASDSTCFVRHDRTNRINLAEEIKKLSDKLLKFNNSSDVENNNESDNYFYSSVSTKSTVFDSDLWSRRPKFKLSNHNHEVALAPPAWSSESSSSASSVQSAPQSPDMTKELLTLLNKYEDIEPRPIAEHRKSLSMEWSDVQTIGQRTMRSLSNYIQSSRGSVVKKKKDQFVTQ